MRRIQQVRRGTILRWFLIAGVVLAPLALYAGKPKTLDTSNYPRVAVLVCRMVGQNGLLSDIQPETDYSVRAPGKKADVCGEDETRLRAAFPAYPQFMDSHMPQMVRSFFANLTAPITEALSATLGQKGRTVVDAREKAATWTKPLSDMTLKEVLTGLAGQADALVVMHYLDGGDALYDCVKFRRVDKGFSSLQCKLALFDISSGQRVAQVETGFNPMAVMAVDPAILDNQALKDKIKIVDPAAKDYVFGRGFYASERQGVFFSRGSATVFTFTDAEIQSYAIGYLKTGFHDPKHMQDIAGLQTLIQ